MLVEEVEQVSNTNRELRIHKQMKKKGWWGRDHPNSENQNLHMAGRTATFRNTSKNLTEIVGLLHTLGGAVVASIV
jgi:ABC-type siderophore export system fused ATPase/permease subunit